MKFLQRTPFFRLSLPVVAGILLYNYCQLPLWSICTLFGGAAICWIASWRVHPVATQYRLRWLFGCGTFAFLIALSYILCVQNEQRHAFGHLGEEGFFLVELIRPPIEKERSYQCEVKTLQFTDSAATSHSRGKGYVYFAKDERAQALSFGDVVLIKTTFTPPASLHNPGGFDYALYLKRKGIGATSYVPTDHWDTVGRNEARTITALAQQCRSRALNTFRQYDFLPDNFAVLAALTFGYTDELTTDLRNGYSASGITHILAVSGLHVGIIYFILAFLLGRLNRSTAQRRLKAAIILLALWSYAFITGLPPSAFRATLMFSFVTIGTMLKRQPSIYNTIFMSAFFMLLTDPNLLFSVGFQLSYSAVLSIVYFQPRIAGLVNFKHKLLRRLWDLTAVSVSAQLGTMPFTLYYFQTFPNYFLLTNLVAIPATSVILYLAILLLAATPIPFIARITAFLLNSTLSLLNNMVDMVQHLPYPTTTIAINAPQAILFVSGVCLCCHYFHSRKYYSLICGLSCILSFLIINTAILFDTARTHQMIVYSSYRNTHVNLITGGNNYIHTSDSTDLNRTASHYWNSRKTSTPIHIDSELIRFRGQKIFILKDDFCNAHTTCHPLHVDYLIIGNGTKPKAKELLECIRPQHVIVDNTITPWYTRQLHEHCLANGIAFHSTRPDGAFILDID